MMKESIFTKYWEVVKKSWLPVTVLLVIAGGTLIGLGRRKQQKQNNKYKLKAWITE